MSNILRRIEIPIFLTIFFTLLQVVPYYFSLEDDPKKVDIIAQTATTTSQWVILIVSWATFIGVISLIQVHTRTVQRRQPGWYFSILVLATVIIMTIVGLPIGEIGLGVKNNVYLFLFNNFQIPLSGTM